MKVDDISVGQYVTVLSWKTHERVVGGGFDGTPATVVLRSDSSFMGEVLKIEAISLPYVVVAHLKGYLKGKTSSIDTREAELTVVSPEYVSSILEASK